MRLVSVFALAAALTSFAGAFQPPTPPETAPVPIPVPDGPVIHKAELDGGLLVEDLVIGTGYEVKEQGAVVALYHGTLKATGKVFDSAFERGKPIAFSLNGVILGWQKGVPGMKVGGVRRLTIPAAMAYGDRAMGPDLPANSDLVFVIQLTDALQVEDIAPGEGEAATARCVPATAHTIKVNGEVVETTTAARPFIWLPGEVNAPGTQFDAMQAALAGMKVGGKRRIHVPAEMNHAPPQLQVKRPQGVDLEIEAELIAVRNLPG
ncbi:MAG: peptidyl-prolyl cis-trans isomerase [Phycisphaerae bacterium]|nr:MAG: peptidyl-prolyl cis-trans isomerase [Phycisphaerae bacterium]